MTATLETTLAGPREAGRLCAICQTGIAPGETVGPCPACASPFHAECWQENGGCATYGCAHMPETVKAVDPLEQKTHWGQDEKRCPECGQSIKVAALRCRHCGAVFETSDPLSRQEYRDREEIAAHKPAGRTAAVAIFALGVLPCTAPIALVFGGAWSLGNRSLVKRLPATHRVLLYVGLATSALTSALLAVAMAIHKG